MKRVMGGLLAVVVLMAACTAEVTVTPVITPLAAGVGPSGEIVEVTASGKVVAAKVVSVGFDMGGRVTELRVAEGDVVRAGDPLASLDMADLAADLALAEAALVVARAERARLDAVPSVAAVDAAVAEVRTASAALSQTLVMRRAPGVGVSAAERAGAEAAVLAVTADRREAYETHDLMLTCVEIPGYGEICPLLGAPEETTRFVWQAAEAELVAAQAAKEAVGPAGWAETRTADAAIRLAEAQEQLALASLASVTAPVSREELALADAAVAEAEAAVQAVAAMAEHAIVHAPVDGTVIDLAVAPGEVAQPGQAAVTLADLGVLRVETTDLSELDVGRVRSGEAVRVTLEALGGQEIAGVVRRVRPMPGMVGGDVVHTVVIDLDGTPSELRMGMSVEVAIDVSGVPEAPAGADTQAGDVVAEASGQVVPPESVNASFTVPGRVRDLAVVEGDVIEAGQMVASLDAGDMMLVVAQAEAALATAEAGLALVVRGAGPANIALARAGLAVAEAARDQAIAAGTQDTVAGRRAAFAAAEAAVAAASAGEKAARIYEIQQREKGIEDWQEEVNLMRLHAAEQALAAAEAGLAEVKAGFGTASQQQAALVTQLEAQVDAAAANVALVEAGAGSEAIAAAEAQLAMAAVAVENAKAALDHAELRAPVSGTVVSVVTDRGRVAVPGVPVVVLADLAALEVETTDFSERDLAAISVGSPAAVAVEALDATVPGRVARIAYEPVVVGGDVTYPVRVVLGDVPAGLLWGMSVEVAFLGGE